MCWVTEAPSTFPFLQVPWANLGKSSVIVTIDRLYILAGPKTEGTSSEDEEYEVSRIFPVFVHRSPCTQVHIANPLSVHFVRLNMPSAFPNSG